MREKRSGARCRTIKLLKTKVTSLQGAKKKGGAEEAKKEEAKKEEIKFDPITPESLMIGKPFGKANKKFAKVRQSDLILCTFGG